ncbi:MAG: ubiquinone biosynthesis protein UbiB [Deltaproteobacteria bacterium]|nr:MAG: ubiquinone biosynthesis protein UbiB [Deltaproteobacteria bacterium]
MGVLSLIARVQDIQRLRQILKVFAKYGYGHVIERMGLQSSRLLGVILPQPSIKSPSDPEQLRRAFEELGPTFVKLGQVLSTRPDLIPHTYIEEFSKLQDKVSPFPLEEARETFEKELGYSFEEAFLEFDSTPIASASLSQVYRATLKDGTRVAVKIQRPGIKPLIKSDIDLLYILARIAETSIPELKLYNPVKIIREFERAIEKELDFTIEAANAERFRRNFHSSSDICFPKVHDRFSSKRILTMDFIDGVKITEASLSGYDPRELARCGLRTVIQMIFRDGFFHADPHPGNVIVTKDGRLAYLDLGLVGRVSEATRDKMLMLLLAIIREDFEEVTRIFYKIGIKEDRVDMEEFRSDVVDICERHFGKPLKFIELGTFIKDLLEGALRHRIRIPHEYALMCKALITMEGVGKKLDPDINIFKESYPYLIDIFKKRYSLNRLSKDLLTAFVTVSQLLQEIPPQLKETINNIERGGVKTNDIPEHKKIFTLERIVNRVIIALLTCLCIAVSIILFVFSKSLWMVSFSVVWLLTGFLLGTWLIISILKSRNF